MALGPNQMIALGGLLLLAAWILQKNLWRAVLFVAPASIRIEPDAPADAVRIPVELLALDECVRELGFASIGSRTEHPRFGRESVCYDYVHLQDQAFATLSLSGTAAREKSPQLYFLTPTEAGGFVITANYRRPARELPGRYASGGLESAPPERVYKAHLRVRKSFGSPRGTFDQSARVDVAREWFSGLGRAEVREQNLHGLLWSAGSLGMVGAAIFGSRG